MGTLIELDEITKDYGAFRALDQVSLRVETGITALLGPNGAGKSTLIKVLLGLLQTTSGRGRLLDFEIGRQVRQIRANVGYMPEDDCYLHGLTGVESVQLSARPTRFLIFAASPRNATGPSKRIRPACGKSCGLPRRWFTTRRF
jgi:ABC-2 type transport system ATP-binding protein